MIYDISNCSVIYKTKDRFGELSNMCSGFPIEYNGKMFYSTEALYQCCRFPQRADFHKEINVSNAMLAKMKSKPIRKYTRKDWFDQRVSIMEACLRLKTDQHYDRISAVLYETGETSIVEKSRNDDFWGTKPFSETLLKGDNVLGLLWMMIREEIRQDIFHNTAILTVD